MEPSLSRRSLADNERLRATQRHRLAPLTLLTAEVFAFIGTDVALSFRPR